MQKGSAQIILLILTVILVVVSGIIGVYFFGKGEEKIKEYPLFEVGNFSVSSGLFGKLLTTISQKITPTSTPAPTSLPTLVTPLPSSNPTSTPISQSSSATPSPSSAQKSSSSASTSTTGQIALGIGVDSSTISWWNSLAKDSDLIIGNVPTLNSVASAKGIRVLMVNPSNPSSDMDTAKSKGWTVTSNIESTDLNYVISQEKQQYQMAKDRGLTFTFGPTGLQLEDEWDYTYQSQDHALLRNADIIAYQAQHFQDDSRMLGTSDSSKYVSAFASKVKDLISKIKPYIAQHQVHVQVSVNPPANRCTSADQVIKYMDSIMSGSNTPDAIVIFVSSQYDSQCSEKRVDVMKKIVEYYR